MGEERCGGTEEHQMVGRGQLRGLRVYIYTVWVRNDIRRTLSMWCHSSRIHSACICRDELEFSKVLGFDYQNNWAAMKIIIRS